MISLASCAPKVVVPEIDYESHAALKEGQPDCTAEIEAVQVSSGTDEDAILSALYCYREVWKYWENNYRVLDAQVKALEGEEK